ncbi:GTPase domain-containing protein [Geodermatophilus sp. SYSU D01176]
MLLHELALRADELLARLRELLADIPAPDLAERATRSPGPVPRIVFTGQFSSGKSTLIKALTDGAADVVIDARPATDAVKDYDWDGVVLLTDTPGVQAGIRDHDDLATEALATAHFVVFAVSVELFDDACAQYLRRVVIDGNRARQTIVVITKSGTMPAAPGVREEAVRQALQNPGLELPVVETDADFYLRSLERPARGEQMRKASNIDNLRQVLNELSRQSGELAALAAPYQLVKSLCAEAEALVVADPSEAAALGLLGRQRRALSDRRLRIDNQVGSLSAKFRYNCQRVGEDYLVRCDEAVAESSNDEAAAEQAMQRLSDDLRQQLVALANEYGTKLQSVVEQQMTDLMSEVAEIDDSPRALALREPEVAISSPRVGDVSVRPQATARSSHEGAPWLRKIGPWLNRFNEQWGAGSGLRDSSGTFGHRVILNIGHKFGKRFAPWEAVRFADTVGKIGRYASSALPYLMLAVDGFQAWQDDRQRAAAERADQLRRRQLVFDVLSLADQIAEQAAQDLRECIDPSFREAYAEIDQMIAEIRSTAAARGAVSDELRAIQAEAEQQLSRIV